MNELIQNAIIAEYHGTHKILVNEPNHLEVQDRDGLVAVYEGDGYSMSPLYIDPLPYTTDLNAIHEVEKLLDNDQWHKYVSIIGRHDYKTLTHATASIKSYAIIKTIR
jgi:hypothetical protein